MSEQEKREPHRWKPGQSGNPRGRPRSGNALAEKIREAVEPDELVSIATTIARTAETDRDRLAALTFLAERGYHKPAERLEVAQGTPDDDEIDVSNLSFDELRRLEALEVERQKILTGATRALPGAVIDVES